MPFETYKTYLAMKQHFTKDKYDYHKYCGRSRATLSAFHKRKDRYFFEKMSRSHPDKEIEDYFVANFVSCKDPETLWIGEIIREGDDNFRQWQKKVQSLSYVFKEDATSLFEEQRMDDVFDCSSGHPPILKSYLGGFTSLETLVICDRILGYVKNFDKKLKDPVWETVSRRIKKYTPFLNINVPRYKKVLKEVVTHGHD
jgi:hypothetical protein